MKILGIDPGFATMGFGLIEKEKSKIRLLEYGIISTKKNKRFSTRLISIYKGLNSIIKKYRPDRAAIERLYWGKNVKTGIQVSEARGVILLSLEQHNIPFFEFTPIQVKKNITGSSRSNKIIIQQFIRSLLGICELPKPDDVADALAIAIAAANLL